MSWHRERPVGFGRETTGTEPLESGIVSAAVIAVECAGGEPVRRGVRPVSPGVRIPGRASAIHGGNERAAAEGRPPREAADDTTGTPAVAYDAAAGPRTRAASQVSRGPARRRPAGRTGTRAA